MFTDKQFLFAEKITSDKFFDLSEMPDEYKFFYDNNLLDTVRVVGADNQLRIGYKLNSRGQELYEDYKRMSKDEIRKDKTLEIAEESNCIAKKANQKAFRANLISLFAFIVSVFALVLPYIIQACSK